MKWFISFVPRTHAVCAGLLSLLVGCGPGSTGEAQEDLIGTHLTFEEFEAQTYQEPETGIYIVDGDTPLEDREQLRRYYEAYVRDGALAIYSWGQDSRWADTQKQRLTYCVSRTFGDRYEAVATAMNEAAKAWEGAADVLFIHRSDQDGTCDAANPNVVFDVNPTSGQSYVARAFFPHYGRGIRNILIDSQAFGSMGSWTLAGVLRHELGHTLGFRHEHIRPEAGNTASGCTDGGGDTQWRPLTGYDSSSVMHYPQCRGTNQGDLVLTDADRYGSALIYGAAQWPFMHRWATRQGNFWDAQKWMAGDFNGDGKADLANVWNDGGSGTIDVYVSFGSGFTLQRWATRQGLFWDTQQWLAGDFNGDGKTDLAKAFNDNGSGEGSIDVHVSTGSGFTMLRWATRQGGFWDAQKWIAGDFNGDGKTDLAKVFNDNNSGEGSIDVHVSSGSSFFMQRWATRQGRFWDTQQWLAGDFNGDGKTDLAKAFNDNDSGMGSIDVHLSSSTGFTMLRWATRQGGFSDGQKWMAGDFNGDGRTDLAKVWNDAGMGTADVHLSSGFSVSMHRWTTRQGNYWDEQKWMAGDFNGDGRADLSKAFYDAGQASMDVHSR